MKFQAGRLTDVKTTGTQATTHTAHYAFDLNSNRTSVTRDGVTTSATYNNQDEIIAYGSMAYSYTKNGEVSGITDTATSQSKSFQYDVFGHLLGVTLSGSSPSTDKSISYIVDADGRRIGRIANGQVTDEMLYQGNYRPLLWMVQDSQGHHVFKGSFIYGSKPNSPDAMLKLDNGIYKSYKIISDERGSVRLVIDGTDGSIAQRIDYDEFGRVITDTNPGFQPFGFAGGWYDNDTKLVHFGERDYDPETGRWLQRDPIGFSGGDVNLYGYTLGDPVSLIDPEGNLPRQPAEGNSGLPPSECSLYSGQLCNQNPTSTYACATAPWLCSKFPNNDTSNCMRACLQRKEIEGSSRMCPQGDNPSDKAAFELTIHGECATTCVFQ